MSQIHFNTSILLLMVILVQNGGCDHVRAKIGDQYLSMGGNVKGIDYDLANNCITSFDISCASGQYRDRRIDLFLRGGDAAMMVKNFTEGNITYGVNDLFISNASAIDLSYKTPESTFETFCIGSFSTEIKISSARMNATEEA